MADGQAELSATPSQGRVVRDVVLWLALMAACSRVLADLAGHWGAEPWSLYSALFAPLLVVACCLPGFEPSPRSRGASAFGYLYLLGGLTIVAAAVGGGMPRLARVALPFAVVGTARLLGRPAPAVAWLALWIVPVPSSLIDLAARLLDPAWTMLSGATIRCPRPAALLPLLALLAGLGHYAAVRRGEGGERVIRSAAAWGLSAIPLQSVVWLVSRFAPGAALLAWPGVALAGLALIEWRQWKRTDERRRAHVAEADTHGTRESGAPLHGSSERVAPRQPHGPDDARHELNELALDLRSALEAALSAAGRGPLGRTERIPPSNPWADDPAKFRVFDASGRVAAVALVSNENGPQLIAQAMERAREARRALGESLGRVVIEPLAEGQMAERSYAILPYCRPLSDSRVVWLAQRALLRHPVLSWLRGVARETQQDLGDTDEAKSFRDPLAHLAELSQLPQQTRDQARSALQRLESGEWQPRHVLVHNDLWKGNLLTRADASPLDRRRSFVVIDWPGSLLHGYPIVDLIRIARSFRLPARALQRELDAHCAILGCVRADARSNLLAGLGKLGMDLDQFPLEDYVALVNGCLSTLDASYPQ